jgi:hypothetical protein
MRVTVRLANKERIEVVSCGEPPHQSAFLEIARGDETRGSTFLSPKELDRLASAIQRVIVHQRRERARADEGRAT